VPEAEAGVGGVDDLEWFGRGAACRQCGLLCQVGIGVKGEGLIRVAGEGDLLTISVGDLRFFP